MKTILLLILLSVNSYSQEYVTPEELEEGWGFGYVYPLWSVESYPKSIIKDFKVNKDENILYLKYFKDYGYPRNFTEIYFDLNKKEYIQQNWKVKSDYNYDSNIFTYYDVNNQTLFLELDGKELILSCDNLINCEGNILKKCNIGNYIISSSEGNYSYFTLKNNENKVDIYKINLDSLFETKCINYELVYQSEITKDSIIFSRNSEKNFINTITKYLIPIGFDLFENYNLIKSIEISKKLNWIVSIDYDAFHDFRGDFSRKNNIKMGNFGDVYIYTSFRSESEPNSDNYKPENHPEAKEARDASGIYRIDTNGHNPVQLVRSWTNHPGGLQISGDGETIYYAYILPDSTSAIMKMDRYGKNKEIVFKLDPKALSVEKPSLKPNIYPNPANEKITISGIENGKIEIYNIMGQKLIEKEINGTSQIDISKIQTRLCILKIESAGKIIYEKILINK